MRIGIDARLIQETGVGRYIRNLIDGLSGIDDTNEYVIFLTSTSFDRFVVPNARWKKVHADVSWHSVREQLVMPSLFAHEKLDVVHVPYFSIPILYNGAMIVTIHDLIIEHFDTGKASTHSRLFYRLKRFLYTMVVSIGVRKARHIITPSVATKDEVVSHYGVSENKITVTHEGIDTHITSFRQAAQKEKPLVRTPYFLYVGNAYPHKNVRTVIDAISHADVHMVFVGKKDFFYQRLAQDVSKQGLSSRVTFFGFAQDRQLALLYTHAEALVFPSLMEGFGLPPLEAIACGCPVIASDIPVHREILGDLVTYFAPIDSQALATLFTGWKKRDHQVTEKEEKEFLKKYDWHDMAKITLHLYESCTRI